MFCPTCGAQIEEGSRFCVSCGAPIQPHEDASASGEQAGAAEGKTDVAAVPSSADQTMVTPAALTERAAPDQGMPGQDATAEIRYCTACGAPIQPGMRFCVSCGAPVEVFADGDTAYATGSAAYTTGPAYDYAGAQAGGYPPTLPADYPGGQSNGCAAPSPQYPPQEIPAAQSAGRPNPALIAVPVALVVVLLGFVAVHYFGLVDDTEALPFLPTQEQSWSETAGTGTETSNKTDDNQGQSESSSQPDVQPNTATVPDVTYESQSAAENDLEAAGFTVGSVTEQTSDQDRGTVISQSVTGEADRGTSVDLVVSKGRQKAYTVISQAVTWEEAESYCTAHGGHLASITSQEEWDQALAAMRASGRKVFWIGGTRDSGDDMFYWIDGSPWSFTAWADGEPNNDDGSGGSEYYMAIYLVDGSYGWYDCPDDLSSYYKDSAMAFLMETY